MSMSAKVGDRERQSSAMIMPALVNELFHASHQGQ
jgi:hypothetical protein